MNKDHRDPQELTGMERWPASPMWQFVGPQLWTRPFWMCLPRQCPSRRQWACAKQSSDPDGSLLPPQQAPLPGQTPQPSATTSRCPERCSRPLSSAQWSSLMGLRQPLCDLAEHTSRTCPDPERIAWRVCVESVPLEAVPSILVAFWRGSWGHPSWCHLLERMWLPCWRELTQLNQSLCAFSPRLNTVNLSVTSTQRSCFVSCGSCLPLPQRGDPVAFCKHGKPFTELVLGDQPSLPCLKRRILGSNRKSFHARVLDGSDLWQSLLHCKPHCTLVRPFRNAGGFFITNVLSRKTFSRFTSSSVANALEIARLLLTTGTTTSSTLDSTRWGMPSASNSVSSSLDATGSRWSTSGTLTRVSVSESTASSWTL